MCLRFFLHLIILSSPPPPPPPTHAHTQTVSIHFSFYVFLSVLLHPAEEISSLRKLVDTERAAPRFSFQLEKRQLSTVHLNAITR